MREEFDPDQPRDEQGEWTSGGGGSGGSRVIGKDWSDLGVTANPDTPDRLAMSRETFEKLRGGRTDYQPGEKVLVWRDETNVRIATIDSRGRQGDGSYTAEGKNDPRPRAPAVAWLPSGGMGNWNKDARNLAPYPKFRSIVPKADG